MKYTLFNSKRKKKKKGQNEENINHEIYYLVTVTDPMYGGGTQLPITTLLPYN